jgi:hypothetical protein
VRPRQVSTRTALLVGAGVGAVIVGVALAIALTGPSHTAPAKTIESPQPAAADVGVGAFVYEPTRHAAEVVVVIHNSERVTASYTIDLSLRTAGGHTTDTAHLVVAGVPSDGQLSRVGVFSSVPRTPVKGYRVVLTSVTRTP